MPIGQDVGLQKELVMSINEGVCVISKSISFLRLTECKRTGFFLHHKLLPFAVDGDLFQRFVVLVQKSASCWTVSLVVVERLASCWIAPVENDIFT